HMKMPPSIMYFMAPESSNCSNGDFSTASANSNIMMHSRDRAEPDAQARVVVPLLVRRARALLVIQVRFFLEQSQHLGQGEPAAGVLGGVARLVVPAALVVAGEGLLIVVAHAVALAGPEHRVRR